MSAPQRSYLRLAVAVACALAAAIAAIVLFEYAGRAFLSSSSVSEGNRPTPAAASPADTAKAPAQMSLHETPQVVPGFGFEDGSGRPLTLAEFKGRVVLLNIWATWCIPCREEMPTLDRLQTELGGPDFQVVALSIDRGGVEAVRPFYGEIGIERLAIYVDSSGKAANALGVIGLPTTLLVDRQGYEIGRLVGPAEWDSPEMTTFLRNHLTERAGAISPGGWGQAAMHVRTDTAPEFHLPLAPIVLSSTSARDTHS